ncbi:MAG: lipopolysaccharide biosynthesis protein, partial [Acidobacteriota bacterium]|nr:lipopolysaccharide biosynthesis protein [Acidobacteriota bacterium]
MIKRNCLTMESILEKPSQRLIPEPTKHLDSILVRGLAWTGGVKWIAQLVTWCSTLIIARLLNPADYGLVGMAAVYLGFINLLCEFGVGTTVVTLREMSDDHVAQLNGFSVLLGLSGFALSCVAAVPLGLFFKTPRLPWVVVAMSTTFVISSFQSVPAALLQRELRFKLLSLIDGAKSFILACTMLVLAIAGLRYWTLVIGSILSTLIAAILVVSKRPHRMAWPRPSVLGPILHFSRHIIVNRIAWYAYSNSDFVVAGRILGQQALGAYTVAWNVANVPVEKITSVLNSVTPSLFSAVQKDKAALRRYVLNLTEGLAFVTLPASIGLGLVAREFVLVILGEKWQPAITPLRFLAFYVTIRSITPLIPAVLNVVGESRFNMRNSLVAALVLPCAFVFGSHWGTAGIAAAWIIA